MKDSKLNEVADRQQLDAFEYFSKKWYNFCEVIRDLGLYELMLASRKFAQAPDHDEPDMIEITVQCSNGANIVLELDSAEKIGAIKESIADECGIEPRRQILKFQDKELDQNERSLVDCGIEDESTLTVAPPIIEIAVQCRNGEKIKLEIDPEHPIIETKKKLERETGLPVDNQRLFFDGVELLDNDKSAEEYLIRNGSELDLEPRTINIIVETPDGTELKLPVKLSNTVADVKDHVAAKTHIPIEKQLLVYREKELATDANQTTMKELDIQDGDCFIAKVSKIPITVVSPDGHRHEVMLDPDDALKNIKRDLEGEVDLPAKKMNLFYNDQELEDGDKTLTDFEIQAGSVLHICRVVFFVDEDTGNVGRLPIHKIVGGSATIKASSCTNGKVKERIQQIIIG
jgi:hypothetical protein